MLLDLLNIIASGTEAAASVATTDKRLKNIKKKPDASREETDTIKFYLEETLYHKQLYLEYLKKRDNDFDNYNDLIRNQEIKLKTKKKELKEVKPEERKHLTEEIKLINSEIKKYKNIKEEILVKIYYHQNRYLLYQSGSQSYLGGVGRLHSDIFPDIIKTAIDLDERFIWDATIILTQQSGTINAVNNNGNTALHYAVECNDSTCIKDLISVGADPTIKNKKGKTPYDFSTTDKERDLLTKGREEFERIARAEEAKQKEIEQEKARQRAKQEEDKQEKARQAKDKKKKRKEAFSRKLNTLKQVLSPAGNGAPLSAAKKKPGIQSSTDIVSNPPDPTKKTTTPKRVSSSPVSTKKNTTSFMQVLSLASSGAPLGAAKKKTDIQSSTDIVSNPPDSTKKTTTPKQVLSPASSRALSAAEKKPGIQSSTDIVSNPPDPTKKTTTPKRVSSSPVSTKKNTTSFMQVLSLASSGAPLGAAKKKPGIQSSTVRVSSPPISTKTPKQVVSLASSGAPLGDAKSKSGLQSRAVRVSNPSASTRKTTQDEQIPFSNSSPIVNESQKSYATSTIPQDPTQKIWKEENIYHGNKLITATIGNLNQGYIKQTRTSDGKFDYSVLNSEMDEDDRLQVLKVPRIGSNSFDIVKFNKGGNVVFYQEGKEGESKIGTKTMNKIKTDLKTPTIVTKLTPNSQKTIRDIKDTLDNNLTPPPSRKHTTFHKRQKHITDNKLTLPISL